MRLRSGYQHSSRRRTVIVAAVLVMALFSAGAAPLKRARRDPSIVPLPLRVEFASGEFNLAPGLRIEVQATASEAASVGEWLAEKLGKTTGLPVRLANGPGIPGEKPVRLALRQDLSRLGPEGYLLSVSGRAVLIEAVQPAGLFYGAQTLYQLLPAEIESPSPSSSIIWKVPCLKIEDRPRFGWRGMHLDVCRHFIPWSSSRSTSTCWPCTR